MDKKTQAGFYINSNGFSCWSSTGKSEDAKKPAAADKAPKATSAKPVSSFLYLFIKFIGRETTKGC